MEDSVLLGTKPRHSIRDPSGVFPYDTFASVKSLMDVTIRAFSTLLNELGFLCRLLLASIDKQVLFVCLSDEQE